MLIDKIIIEKVLSMYFIYFSGPNHLAIYNSIAASQPVYSFTQADNPYPPTIHKNTQYNPVFRIFITRFKNKSEKG